MRRLTLSSDAHADILEWFNDLGVIIPDPSPIALRWTDTGCDEIPVDQATDDDVS